MKSEFTGNPNNFVSPATYRIEIDGALDEGWSERLAGMKVKTTKSSNLNPLTILSGRLRDQAELLGVLNALYNLRLTLISVRRQGIQTDRK